MSRPCGKRMGRWLYWCPSDRMRARWVCHVLMVALTTFVSGCGPWPPSDAALERKFRSNRRVFDQLIMMSAEDSHLVRIARDFTFLDTDFSWPRSNIGISNER